MRRWRLALLGCLAALAAGGMALAQGSQGEGSGAPTTARYGLPPLWSSDRPDPGPEPDLVLAGRAIAAGEGVRGAWACQSCHGLHGAGEGSGAFPRLTGQGAWYLTKQLRDYASGRRFNAVMTPIAQGMTDAQMQAVSAWYAAQQDAPWPPRPRSASAMLQRGGALHAVGAPQRGVHACINCHGDRGEGTGPSYPRLAGQYADYTALQLRLWRAGERRNSPLGVMAGIARGMTDEEIEAVSLYYAGIRPEPGR